jgi:hypothetical protein
MDFDESQFKVSGYGSYFFIALGIAMILFNETPNSKQKVGPTAYLPPAAKCMMISFTLFSTSNNLPFNNSLLTSMLAPNILTSV